MEDPGDWQRRLKRVSDQLLRICGENIKTAISLVQAYFTSRFSLQHSYVDLALEQQRMAGWRLMIMQPVLNWLQRGMAECDCSPFGRLHILEQVLSGSMAERLTSMRDGEDLRYTYDSDTMMELGPVHWVTAAGELLTRPVPAPEEELPKAGTGSNANLVQQSTPVRLLMAETANPGFVKVLQEKLDTCPHAEHLPFASHKVQGLIDDLFRVILPYEYHERSGPSAMCIVPELQSVSRTHEIMEHDKVACLHVPAWWPSNEFFERPRNNDWPPKSIRDDIRRFGVYLVPVGAKGSPTEHLEWRVSSSMAELVISTELTDTQANSLIVFKTCKRSMGQDGKLVKSYFAKTALFWLCQDTPTDAWSGALEGAEKIIDFLERYITANSLPAFLLPDINLLKMTSRNERRRMLRTLEKMREKLVKLLLKNAVVVYTIAQVITGIRDIDTLGYVHISSYAGQVSERQFRVMCVRSLIVDSVRKSKEQDRMPPVHGRRLAALLRCSTTENLPSIIPEERTWYFQQISMLRAYLVAPDDVQVQVRLSSKDGRFVWDAAPLMALLTEDDLQEMLGDLGAVRAWLRRQHQLPETQRPPGAPADLRSPRDLCDLLLNVPLLTRAMMETGFEPPYDSDNHDKHSGLSPFDNFQNRLLDEGPELALGVRSHFLSRGYSELHASAAAEQFYAELMEHWDNPATRTEYNRLRTVLPDPWDIGRFMYRRSF